MNETMDKVVVGLNGAWQDLEFAIVNAYDEGYSSLVWQLKQAQLQIEAIENQINNAEYDDE